MDAAKILALLLKLQHALGRAWRKVLQKLWKSSMSPFWYFEKNWLCMKWKSAWCN